MRNRYSKILITFTDLSVRFFNKHFVRLFISDAHQKQILNFWDLDEVQIDQKIASISE